MLARSMHDHIQKTLDEALRLAGLGISVFPLAYGKKTPAVDGGFKAATSDRKQVTDWFQDKQRNLGIPTGRASGLVVIDDDCYAEGGSGLADLIEELGPLPDTYTVNTRAGGAQYYFRHPNGFTIGSNAGKVARHVDIRGDCGYVVAPPSWVDKDDKGPAGLYTVGQDLPWAELPKAWAERLQAASNKEGTLWGATNIAAGFTLPKVVESGARNDTLMKYAGHLRGRGVPDDLIAQTLLDANKARCKPPLDDAEVIGLAERYRKTQQAEDNPSDWPEPQPIEAGLPEVPAFDAAILPEVFRPYVEDAAERMQCPADYIAVPLMVGAAAALGNIIAIAPKGNDIGWLASPTIWGAIVGRPGMMKTPAMDAALKPLSLLESELAEDFAQRQQGHTLRVMEYQAAKGRIEKAVKGGAVIRPEDMPVEPEEPQPERLVINDATVAKLGEVLRWSPRGVLAVRDELTGWLETLSGEGREGDRAFYLSAWNGLQSYRVDRVGRGSFSIPRLNVLVLGGIQPGKLQQYVRAATQGGNGDDGLLQRIQLIVWPDHSKEWRNVDRQPDFAAQEAVIVAFRNLRKIDPVTVGATMPSLGNGPAWLHFSPEAQTLFDAWRETLETSLRTGERHPALESHMAKYRSLIPALALITHLADGATGPVSLAALEKATQWGKYLFKHARRVYASATNAAAFSAKALADKITTGKVESLFTARQVYRNGWAHLSTPEDATTAIEWLIDAGWLRAEQTETGGRRATKYAINPRVTA